MSFTFIWEIEIQFLPGGLGSYLWKPGRSKRKFSEVEKTTHDCRTSGPTPRSELCFSRTRRPRKERAQLALKRVTPAPRKRGGNPWLFARTASVYAGQAPGLQLSHLPLTGASGPHGDVTLRCGECVCWWLSRSLAGEKWVHFWCPYLEGDFRC